MPDVLKFLTPEWFDKINEVAAESVPTTEGVSGVVDMAIRRAAGVTATVTVAVEDGKPTFRLGPAPHAAVTLEYLEEDLGPALVGELDSIAAFAMGRIGAKGDFEAVTDVMILWDGENYRDFRRRIRDFTRFE